MSSHKIKKTTILIFVVITLLPLVFSCKKYEEGPRITLYSKKGRISGNWLFGKVLYNNTDSTENYYRITIEFIKDGRFSYTKTNENNDILSFYLGNWDLINDKNNLEMTFYSFTDTLYTYNWQIKRLTFYDLWIERTDENNNHIRWELLKPR